MTRANVRLFLLAGTTAAATLTGTPATPAQTTPTAHRTGASAHRGTAASHPATRSECVSVPGLSPKIPALPVGSACPKSMITVSEKIELSPLMGPMIRQGFSNLDSSFTLAYVDDRIGTGAPAQPHMFYTVQYTGYLADGTKFDSSLDHGDKKTLSFPYGAHRVIPGWDLGFEGMRLGGKRRLFVPWQLAYGERGKPPVIPPKSELIFDMELIAQSPTDPDAPPSPPTPPAGPGSPSASPVLGNPPSVTVPQGTQPARPRTAPDAIPTSPNSTSPNSTSPKPATPSPAAPNPAVPTPPPSNPPSGGLR